MTVRWGVAGPGPVADKVLRDLAHVPDAVLTAVGSRSAERAEAFATAHAASGGHRRVPTAHRSYRALLGDPDVDSEIMPLADTVAVQDVLSQIADQLGIRVIEGPAELP